MQASLIGRKLSNLEEFKKLLVQLWGKIPENTIRAACNSFPKRLRAIIKAKDERFE